MSDILHEIRRLLWREWDPIGINHSADGPDDEYDIYAKGVYRMLCEGRDHHAISSYLERSALQDIGVQKSANHDEVATRAIALFGNANCGVNASESRGRSMTIFRSDIAAAMLADLLCNQDIWWDSELHTITGYSRAEYVALERCILAQDEPPTAQDSAMLHAAANNLLGYPGISQAHVAAACGDEWQAEIAKFLTPMGGV